MKAKIYAFNYEIDPAINQDAFWSFVNLSGSLRYKGVDRYLFLRQDNAIYTGLLLSERNREHMPEFRHLGLRIEMNLAGPTAGHVGGEFNLFIVNTSIVRD